MLLVVTNPWRNITNYAVPLSAVYLNLFYLIVLVLQFAIFIFINLILSYSRQLKGTLNNQIFFLGASEAHTRAKGTSY